MSTSPWGAPVEFEVVSRAPLPGGPAVAEAPVAPVPARPVGVSILAVLGMGVAAMFAFALLAFLFMMLFDGGDEFAFAIFTIVLVVGGPVVLGGGLVGWGMWQGRKWAWVGGLVVAGLWGGGTLARAAAVVEVDPFAALPAVVPIGIIAYLVQPGVRAYFDAPRPAGHGNAADGGMDSGTRAALFAGACLLVIVAAALAQAPMQSLLSSADGATLRSDATVGLVGGVLILGAGLAAMIVASQRYGEDVGVWAPLGGAAGAAALALALITAANEAATAPVLDGRATGGDAGRTFVVLAAVANLVTAGIIILRRAVTPVATLRLATVSGIAWGLGTAAFAAYLLSEAGRLQSQAAAREHLRTPGLELVLVLAALAALALIHRRYQKED